MEFPHSNATKSKRYQVFTAKEQSQPVFRTRWRFLAKLYATWVCAWGGRDYCRIENPDGVTILEQAKALPL